MFRGFIVRMLCKHRWKLFRTIHGDEANYARSEWRCEYCDKHRYSKFSDAMEQDVGKTRWKDFKETLLYFRDYIGYLLLSKKNKDALYREHLARLEIADVEHWMCESPEAVAVARRLRVRIYGYKEGIPYDHPDRTASQSIAEWRERYRNTYK